jgi:hypothetical protein
VVGFPRRMTRSHPSLQRHLLTRSDFARLQVPAADVLAWLADGSLDQIGALPGAGIGDPVFTVTSEALRERLESLLRAAGRRDVVLAPREVRTFLLRTLVDDRPAAASGGAAGEGPGVAPAMPADLADVLHDVLQAIERDGIPVMQAIAAGVADDGHPAVAVPAPPGDATVLVAAGGDEAAGPAPRSAADGAGEEDCFDADHLEAALAALDGGGDAPGAGAHDEARADARTARPSLAPEPGAAATVAVEAHAASAAVPATQPADAPNAAARPPMAPADTLAAQSGTPARERTRRPSRGCRRSRRPTRRPRRRPWRCRRSRRAPGEARRRCRRSRRSTPRSRGRRTIPPEPP